MPDKKLPAVPETILKRRKRQAAARAERAKAVVAAKKVSAVNMNNFDFIYLLKIPQRTVLSFPIYIQCQMFVTQCIVSDGTRQEEGSVPAR